ncbi:MAG TPA: phosphonoacetaldehyde hydrolase [Geminicoccus sp.]|uniref:phosphonoacetaldehyde hydrolase n=1 Tax=Geminicoccus sp. TaxID=2024832 RepID=UPI002E346939|nr:phosphonoacetaldehyde hydrolase [Geminicoccus sp.]HEX2525131.1 phosphonoacetaldehyde hydrolase [Geminicoccus sp.]
MSFRYRRFYAGPVEAVIFDMAGTVVDFGSRAPAGVFVEVFRRHGVEISLAEARGPMGAEKRAHVAELLAAPAIQARFVARHGRASTEGDVDAIYQDFIPLQIETLPAFSDLIPGVLDTVAALRARGIRIGVNTGYNRAMMEVVLAAMERQGLHVDSAVAASDVRRARPFPAMCLTNAADLAVRSVAACIKVDDTIPGIDEGLSAGMWTVAITASGNEVGLDEKDWKALTPAQQADRIGWASDRMRAAGAHYVIPSVAELLPVVDAIEARLARGEQP